MLMIIVYTDSTLHMYRHSTESLLDAHWWIVRIISNPHRHHTRRCHTSLHHTWYTLHARPVIMLLYMHPTHHTRRPPLHYNTIVDMSANPRPCRYAPFHHHSMSMPTPIHASTHTVIVTHTTVPCHVPPARPYPTPHHSHPPSCT